ncbi:MAG: hypothetical protein COU51_02265 [Parcubacteria group bacterium CG10_big_fil_rev_8_21_14_0_10_36_14]|nr:MAG: hypothetical protein COU51_02265 [Parcubacteria group bacterium CG10_big_fil_rev_8_21_14_0_10_36_14]
MGKKKKTKKSLTDIICLSVGGIVVGLFCYLGLLSLIEKMNIGFWFKQTKIFDYIVPLIIILAVVVASIIFFEKFGSRRFLTLQNIGIILVLLGTIYIGFIATRASSIEPPFTTISTAECNTKPEASNCERYGMLFVRYPEYLVTGLFIILMGSMLQIKPKNSYT